MSTEAELRDKVAALEQEVATLKQRGFPGNPGVRRRSTYTVLGMPLFDIALDPDPEAGELRGHAKGFIAIGDIATGVIALGGAAFGLVAVGGLAVGGLCLGGAAIGLLLGVGGFATGALAIGGGAIGAIAIGGGAAGYYAIGGAAGQYVIDATRQDPEAIRLFTSIKDYVPLVADVLDKIQQQP